MLVKGVRPGGAIDKDGFIQVPGLMILPEFATYGLNFHLAWV